MFGSLQILALASIASVALGFTAGLKWEKADRYEDAKSQIIAIQDQAILSRDLLNERWEAEAAQVKVIMDDWGTQNRMDNEMIKRLLAGQTIIKGKFDDINTEITITTDFGQCTFSPDAIRLLRESSAAANQTDSLPND